MLRNICTICLGITLIALTSFNLVHAAPAGTVQTDFGGRESITATALQGDGKLIAVGFFYGGGSNSFALARYGTDGKLDTTFGTGGKVLTTNFGASSGYAGQAEAKAVALQADGKIVVAGDAYTNDIALARYNPDGSLDTTFGNGGKVVTDWGAASELAFAVGIQSTGKVIVGGYTDTKGTFDFVMTRYNSDGTVDATFGTNGTVYTDFTASDDRIEALKVIVGDKIIAVGRSNYNIALAQYTAAGVLDTQFGTSGKVTTDLGGYYWEGARAVAIDANRKIVVAGQAGPNSDIAVLRYSSSGSLDGKFGSGGKVLTNLGSTNDQAAAVGIDSSGKIVVAGYVGNGSGFEVLRYTSGGALDNTFGSAGRVTTRIGSNSYEQAVALAIQGDNKIVVGGNAGSSITQDNFALARYNTNGILDSSYGAKANLAITVTSSPSPVKLGSTITHTITVTNNGPDAAEQVMISGASSPLATLASGATTTLTQTATVEVGGSLTFTATVDSITADPDSANNSATSTTPVNGAADLSVTMTANPMLAKLYKPLTYTVTVTNNGPDPAMKVATTHTNPSGSGYVWFSSVSTTQGTCAYDYYSGIRCDIGTMSSGSVVTITLVYTPQANGALTNTANVTGIGDPNTTNNSATVNSTIYTATDLAVTATDSADPVKFGNQVTYTITVKNNGPDAADNVPLWNGVFYQNGLPYYQPDITLVSINSAQGTCTLEPPLPPNTWGAALASCSFPRIESGASATVTLVATSNATGVLELTSRLAGSYYSPDSYPIYLDPDLSNNTAIEHTTVTGSADLVMVVTPSKSSVVPGENLTYNITVTNNGVDPALRTDVSDFMPIGMGFVSISSGQGTCSGETLTTHPYYGGIAGCSFGTLNAGASVSITLVVQAFMTGTVSNAFYAISNISDPTPADGSRTINTTVTGTTDMAISMTDSPDPVRVNNEVTYSIIVTNNGPYPGMATVSDLIPSGTYIRGWAPSQGGCDNTLAEVICKLGVINSGASATISIQVMTTAKGNITNSASVTSSVADSNTANNSTSVVTSVSR